MIITVVEMVCGRKVKRTIVFSRSVWAVAPGCNAAACGSALGPLR